MKTALILCERVAFLVFESGLLLQRNLYISSPSGERSLLVPLSNPSTLVLVHFVYQLAE